MGFFSRARSVLRPSLNPNFRSRVLTTAPECNSSSKISVIYGSPQFVGLGFCGFCQNCTFLGLNSPIFVYSKRFHLGSRNVECFREKTGSSSISRAKGVNFRGYSLISRAKGVNFHGSSSISSSKGVNFHGSSSISSSKGVKFRGYSSISRAKGVNFHGSSSIPRAEGVNFHVSYMHSSIFRPHGLHSSVYTSNIQYNVRHYHVDLGKARSFIERGQRIKLFIGFYLILVPALCFWVYWTAFYFYNLETVPYTKRTRTMPVRIPLERKLVEKVWNDSEKPKLLPATDPSSVRARLIFENIMEALQRKNDLKSTWGEDADWIDKAARGIRYLYGIEWEFLVHESDKTYNVPSCSPDGEIFFSVRYVEAHSDAEIAYAIAHEIGHVIARHVAEKWAREIQILPVKLYFFVFHIFLTLLGLFDMVTDDLVRQPLNHKLEIEADTIVLLLMAYAGCDPQAVPEYHKKESNKLFGLSNEETLSHPSHKKRFEVLSQSKVLEEAIVIYEEKKSRAR